MGVMQPMQSSTPVETDGGQAATDSFQQQLSSASIQLDAAIRARETTSNGTARSLAHTANAFYEDPPLVGYTRTQDLQQQPLVQPAPQYAAPIAKMWQVPTVGWLDARRKAAIEDNSRVDYKKVAAETKIAQKQSVSVMLWTRVSTFAHV
jgi:hypothetical protein